MGQTKAQRAAWAAQQEANRQRVLDAAPPLSDEKKSRLAALLRPYVLAVRDRTASSGRHRAT